MLPSNRLITFVFRCEQMWKYDKGIYRRKANQYLPLDKLTSK
jgi:hypothetical protein